MNAIDVTGTQEQVAAILALARKHGDVEDASEPTNLDASRALNAGIGMTEIGAILAFATIVFKTRSAALEFLKAIREEMKARKAEVAITDPATGKPRGRISGTTDDAALARMAG